MRKRKIGIIAFLSILNIPVSIVFSTMIHSKLSNIKFSKLIVFTKPPFIYEKTPNLEV